MLIVSQKTKGSSLSVRKQTNPHCNPYCVSVDKGNRIVRGITTEIALRAVLFVTSRTVGPIVQEREELHGQINVLQRQLNLTEKVMTENCHSTTEFGIEIKNFVNRETAL